MKIGVIIFSVLSLNALCAVAGEMPGEPGSFSCGKFYSKFPDDALKNECRHDMPTSYFEGSTHSLFCCTKIGGNLDQLQKFTTQQLLGEIQKRNIKE
jgi:hypothetical protein